MDNNEQLKLPKVKNAGGAVPSNIDGYLQDAASYTEHHNLSLGELDDNRSESLQNVVDTILHEKSKNAHVQRALEEVKGMPALTAEEKGVLTSLLADNKQDYLDNGNFGIGLDNNYINDHIKDDIRMAYAAIPLVRELGFPLSAVKDRHLPENLADAISGVNDLKRQGVKITGIYEDFANVVWRLCHQEVIEGLLQEKGNYKKGIRASGVSWD